MSDRPEDVVDEITRQREREALEAELLDGVMGVLSAIVDTCELTEHRDGEMHSDTDRRHDWRCDCIVRAITPTVVGMILNHSEHSVPVADVEAAIAKHTFSIEGWQGTYYREAVLASALRSELGL